MNAPLPHKPSPAPAAPIPAEIQALVDGAPRPIQHKFRLWCKAVAAMDKAKDKRRIARVFGRRLCVRPGYIWNKRSEFRKHGYIALLDRSYSPDLWAGWHRVNLPPMAGAYLKKFAAENQLPAADAIRAFKSQLKRWQAGDTSAKIPGYDRPPVREKPPGWSNRNLARFLAPRTRPPAPGPALLKVEFTIRRQGNALIFSARQTFPKPAAPARSDAKTERPRP